MCEHLNPLECWEHHEFGGHLLLRIFSQVPLCEFPTNVDVFDTFPVGGHLIDALLLLLALSYGYQERASETLLLHLDRQHLSQALELLKVIKGSQVANLALLTGICWRYYIHRQVGCCSIYPADVTAISLCIKKALELPLEQKSSILIGGLIENVRWLHSSMVPCECHQAEGQDAASLAAIDVINRLEAHMRTIMVVGRRSCMALSCARTHGSYSPAIGWLPQYTD